MEYYLEFPFTTIKRKQSLPMKIGILTYHFAINYGAVFQCYALQEYLKQQGYEVEVINFIPANYKRAKFWKNNKLRHSPICGIKKMYIKFRYGKSLIKKFERFRIQYLQCSKNIDYNTFEETINQYDAVISGSDQVWGPSRLEDLCYFFDNTHNYKGRKLSYAPCCAINNANKAARHEDIAKLLNEFYDISVRNRETADFVKDMINREPIIVCDPTLLHDFSEFTNNFIPTKERYILTYILGSDIEGGNENAILEIKKKTGIKNVYTIVLSENAPKFIHWATKVLYEVDPIEWLRLFYNSSFIYTDSFHGVMFAIKFQKNLLLIIQSKIALRASLICKNALD